MSATTLVYGSEMDAHHIPVCQVEALDFVKNNETFFGMVVEGQKYVVTSYDGKTASRAARYPDLIHYYNLEEAELAELYDAMTGYLPENTWTKK